MKTTFLHTADWQLGKPFARINDAEKKAVVRQERIHAIGRIREIVAEEKVSAVLVAGDLFDSPTPDKATVAGACSAIGQLEVPVYVTPGNHDHGGPGCPWEQAFFRSEADKLAPNLHVLLEPEPVELPDMVLFPCPLMRRQETADPAQWLRSIDSAALEEFGDKPRVVLAHGSVQGFDSEADDEDTFSR